MTSVSGGTLTTLLGADPRVMGILNVTPDSFSDGGRFPTPGEAVLAGLAMAEAGAAVVDVGGESTRPRGTAYGGGASEVTEEEEAARVLPVLERLRRARPDLPLSVDTRRAGVASAALEAGATVVNVVTGLDAPAELLRLVARHGAALVLAHCRGTPATTFSVSRFTDVVAEVAADLSAAAERAVAEGVPSERILLDPGLGFGKAPDENYALLAGLARLAPPGVPLVVGASRKAFLGAVTGKPAPERLPESLAACALAIAAAPDRPLLLRVHDVGETVRFLAVLSRARRLTRP